MSTWESTRRRLWVVARVADSVRPVTDGRSDTSIELRLGLAAGWDNRGELEMARPRMGGRVGAMSVGVPDAEMAWARAGARPEEGPTGTVGKGPTVGLAPVRPMVPDEAGADEAAVAPRAVAARAVEDGEEEDGVQSVPRRWLVCDMRSAALTAAQWMAASKAEMPLKDSSVAVSGDLHWNVICMHSSMGMPAAGKESGGTWI